MNNRNENYKGNRGFTLIELLVVIVIIGILSGIVLVSLSGAREEARIAKAKAEIKGIYNSIIMLEIDTSQWPGHQNAYQVNQTDDNEICSDGCSFGLGDNQAGLINTDGSYINWQGPYIDEMSDDPWGNEYFFDTDYDLGGEEWVAVIGSYGPNGESNNQYDDDDIIYVVAR